MNRHVFLIFVIALAAPAGATTTYSSISDGNAGRDYIGDLTAPDIDWTSEPGAGAALELLDADEGAGQTTGRGSVTAYPYTAYNGGPEPKGPEAKGPDTRPWICALMLPSSVIVEAPADASLLQPSTAQGQIPETQIAGETLAP